MSKQKKYLITSALPYANGPLHLGHLAGAYLPGDIYARYCRLKKREVVYICGTDEHGVPITITAEKEGKTPQQVVDYYYENIRASFEKFGMSFDNFSRTSRKIHHETAREFFLSLYEKGYMNRQEVEQYYCTYDRMFLADRYIEGECPYCHSSGARGDQCENCGKWLEPVQLINPACKICGNPPEMRKTFHYFFKLGDFQDPLQNWINSKTNWRSNVVNFCNNWFREGLEDRAVTRDLRWGVSVPLEDAADKVIYVWFEAPIGYISATREWAQNIGQPDRWKDFWQDAENTRLIHFIGKDNIVFHAIIFPATLMGHGGYVLPAQVPANEFLNIKGLKFSTSRGIALWVDDLLDHYPVDSLRYALAVNMPEARDADFLWEEFQAKHNNELADILGNFINRTFIFVQNFFDGILPGSGEADPLDKELLEKLKAAGKEVGARIDDFQFKEATRLFMDAVRFANKYFNDQQPWRTRKNDPEKCATTLNLCVQTARSLAVMMSPVLPFTAEKIWQMLQESGKAAEARWESIGELLIPEGRKIGSVEILFEKIPDETINAELERMKKMQEHKEEDKQEATAETPLVTIDDFKKIQLKTAKILEAERIKGADKLLKLQIEVGQEKRQLVAGIAQHYQPEELVGKTIVVVANLQPAKIRGVESQGMLLAVNDGGNLALLTSDREMDSGLEVS
ncbi:MAG: methionine--tRNA ligase [Calditrichia bacterium]